MSVIPFVVNRNSVGEPLDTVDRRVPEYDEPWLQNLLRKQPRILPVSEIETFYEPLVPIGFESPITTGSFDNLFISHSGYLVLVETKLWKNPKAKREVVAQAIDYGSSIAEWTYDHLCSITRSYVRKYEGADMDLIEWVEHKLGPVEGGHEFFEDTVRRRLREGRFLTLIVGDRIRESVVEMLDYMNKYPHLASDVALIELRCYHMISGESWPLLVVPRVVARTQIVERSVVTVTLESGAEHKISVSQEMVEETPRRKRKGLLSEENFWDLLETNAPDVVGSAKALVEEFRQQEGIRATTASNSITVKLDIQDTGIDATLFFINTEGNLELWPVFIADKLEKAGLQRNLADTYQRKAKSILKMPDDAIEYGRSLRDIDVKELVDAIHEFVAAVSRADTGE